MINITDLNDYKDFVEQYNKETEEYNARVDSYLEEINNNLAELGKSVDTILTEQERQRIENMTIKELQIEMLRNLGEMRAELKKAMERWDR